MKNNLHLANHYYLLYIENKELSKIKSYIAKNSNDTLSFEEKIIILKLHELYKKYHKIKKNKSISLERFLGLLDEDAEDYFENSLNLFYDYFIAKGFEDILGSTKEKFLLKKEKSLIGDYDIKENLRSDKLKKRAEKILWHISPASKAIHSLYLGKSQEKYLNSAYYLANISNYDELVVFLGLKHLDNRTNFFSYIFLKQKLREKKVKIEELEKEHQDLQKELVRFYELIKFFYFG